ncbi:MAG TPA: hypothetical protein P5134_05025 [Bacteroidales bacterium]|nr:hypothetical protein [Bacteroidales bacterium]
MANRRMFAKTIIDSDAFLDMPPSSQALYFHLAMRADDDGFINNPKTIMRIVGAKDDDIQLLIAKRFIIPFDSGVVVIKHWRIHNYVQKDRYTETKYIGEKNQLIINEKNAYSLKQIRLLDDENDNVYILDTQVRLGKDRLGKDRLELERDKNKATRFITPTIDEIKTFLNDQEYETDTDWYANRFYNFYESKGWKVGKEKMKDWKAAIRGWLSRDNIKKKETVAAETIDDTLDPIWEEIKKL